MALYECTLLRPLVPGSLFGVGLPEEFLCGFFLGDDFWIFPCSALLGPTVDTCFFQFTDAFVLGSCDRFSSFSLCYRIQRTAWSPLAHVVRQSTEWYNFMFFYVKRWITDPEVDSRLSGHVFRTLVSDSHLFVASPEE